MDIRSGDLDDPDIVALLQHHVDSALAQSPRESCHALDVTALKGPDIDFFAAWAGDALLGVGALKTLSPEEGEVKSMHTAAAARGRGVGEAMLERIVETARARGLKRLSLETGVQPYFAAAERLYRRHGFVPCPPFADYRPDPNSLFMTLALT